uniref:Uncharacterized protein n=1 Tax=Ananas comosus var. bracteatus TaxID=296719 RepID=A0A6V7PLM0_ANACO|nr:unnamed protein product [Ananas comosus var. bracteatus]
MAAPRGGAAPRSARTKNWAVAGKLSGGRRRAWTAGDARRIAGGRRGRQGAWPQGKCGSKARNLSSAWLGSGQTRLVAASSGGSATLGGGRNASTGRAGRCWDGRGGWG